MLNALIGHTGFVGGNLLRQGEFHAFYNSSNIASMAGGRFDLVVSAGAPAAKWIANSRPDEDRAAIGRLTDVLSRVRADRFCLISTVDVYPLPIGVDEHTPIELERCPPYGRHRYELELFVASRFAQATILRLPGLFGPGLKKNVIYDLLNDNRVDAIHPGGVFQFYDLRHIWSDVSTAVDRRIGLLNVATEPVSVQDVSRAVGVRLPSGAGAADAPRYDFRTVHAAAFGRSGAYLYSRDEVLGGIADFADGVRGRRP